MAIGMIFGKLTAEDYEDHVAADPRIDALRAKMHLAESKQYSSANTTTRPSARMPTRSRCSSRTAPRRRCPKCDYPLGHRKRRKEGIPVLMKKFESAVARVFAPKQRDAIMRLCLDPKRLEALPVNQFMDLLTF